MTKAEEGRGSHSGRWRASVAPSLSAALLLALVLAAFEGPLAGTGIGPVPRPVSALAGRALGSATDAQYHPLSPARLLDTRTALGGHPGAAGSGETIRLQVAGLAGVPEPASVSAVVLNVTAVTPTAAGFVTVFPADQPLPVASTLNFQPGQTVPNLAIVPTGTGGAVALFNYAGSTHLLADIEGYFGSGPEATTAGLFRPEMPVRILDTRGPVGGHPGRVAGGEGFWLQVAGQAAVPPSGAGAVLINVTVTNPGSAGFVTLYPDGGPPPEASNLNYASGQTTANRAVVKLNASGQVAIYNHGGPADVIVDVTGWFTDGSDPGAGGGAFTPLTPVRLLDSRTGNGFSGPVGTALTREVVVGGRGGVPAAPGSVVLNVTVTSPTEAGFVTVFPGQSAVPLASDLNFQPGQTVPNLAIVGLGPGLGVGVYNFAGEAAVVADASGYFTASAGGNPPGPPQLTSAFSGAPATATVTWNPPIASGSGPVVSYTVTDGPMSWAVSPGGSATVPNVPCDAPQSLTVYALNAFGSGPASGVSPPLQPSCPAHHPCSTVPGRRRVVVSKTRQELWACEGDRLVVDAPITTGYPIPALDTPAGSYRVLGHFHPTIFHSPWPSGSPYWYPDTWIEYAVQFTPQGHYLHTSPWAPVYGPGSNQIWGNASHGCVHVPRDPMIQLYSFLREGDAVEVSDG